MPVEDGSLLWSYPESWELLDGAGLGLVFRSPTCPRRAPAFPGGDSGAPGGAGKIGITAPPEGGGRNGTSIAPVEPPFNSFDPAVIAASVGSDASPTNSATIETYRRVGPENPSARYTPPKRFRRTLSGGTRPSSFDCSGTAGTPPQELTETE